MKSVAALLDFGVASRHSVFGLSVATNFIFTVPLLPTDKLCDLVFRVIPNQPWDPHAALIYRSHLRFRCGESTADLYRSLVGGRQILRFPRVGSFFFDRRTIDCFLLEPRSDLAEIRFLGPVLGYWFETKGALSLHASAVAAKNRAVAFISRHGGGKTGLAAGLMRAGAALLTEDLLVVEEREGAWDARPAYPQMRMWPDEATFFAGEPEALPRVQPDSEKRSVAVGPGGFGTFLDASTPLSCIYLASRCQETDGGVEIQPLSRSEALIELVRHSFSPRLVEAAGLQPGRLDRLARLVRSVPVRRLVYPSGFERLGEVAEAVLGSS